MHPKQVRRFRVLLDYMAPLFDSPVDKITSKDIVAAKRADGFPLWLVKSNQTGGDRLRSLCEHSFGAGFAHSNIERDNPAQWDLRLAYLLPAKPLGANQMASLHHQDAPALVRKLDLSKRSHAALALYIATNGDPHAGPYTRATWGETDLKEKVWTVPRERTKAGRTRINQGKKSTIS